MNIKDEIKNLIELTDVTKKLEKELDKLKKDKAAAIQCVTKYMIDNKEFSIDIDNHKIELETRYIANPMHTQINRLHKSLCSAGYSNLVCVKINQEGLNKEVNNMIEYDSKGNIILPQFLRGLITLQEINYINIQPLRKPVKKVASK